jgi:YHS domain-containing protein
MFRTLFFILVLALGLSILLRLVVSIVRSVQGLLGLNQSAEGRRASKPAGKVPSGHFVRDPESGTYIDQNLAIKTVIDGQTYFFESEQTRDAFLRKARG